MYDFNYQTFGKLIRIERTKRNYSQTDLARLSEISKSHISNIELGKCKITLDMLFKLSTALNLSVSFLLNLPVSAPISYAGGSGVSNDEIRCCIRTLEKLVTVGGDLYDVANY